MNDTVGLHVDVRNSGLYVDIRRWVGLRVDVRHGGLTC